MRLIEREGAPGAAGSVLSLAAKERVRDPSIEPGSEVSLDQQVHSIDATDALITVELLGSGSVVQYQRTRGNGDVAQVFVEQSELGVQGRLSLERSGLHAERELQRLLGMQPRITQLGIRIGRRRWLVEETDRRFEICLGCDFVADVQAWVEGISLAAEVIEAPARNDQPALRRLLLCFEIESGVPFEAALGERLFREHAERRLNFLFGRNIGSAAGDAEPIGHQIEPADQTQLLEQSITSLQAQIELHQSQVGADGLAYSDLRVLGTD